MHIFADGKTLTEIKWLASSFFNFQSGNRSHVILARRAFSAIRAAHNRATCTFYPFFAFSQLFPSLWSGDPRTSPGLCGRNPKRWKCASNRRFHRRQDFSPTPSHFSPLLSPLKHRSSFQSVPRALAACAPGRDREKCAALRWALRFAGWPRVAALGRTTGAASVATRVLQDPRHPSPPAPSRIGEGASAWSRASGGTRAVAPRVRVHVQRGGVRRALGAARAEARETGRVRGQDHAVR